jgi:hypothetical protein
MLWFYVVCNYDGTNPKKKKKQQPTCIEWGFFIRPDPDGKDVLVRLSLPLNKLSVLIQCKVKADFGLLPAKKLYTQ